MSRASTPLMEQYREIKSRHQNAILLFRMGDFYEMFYDDAELAARHLGLTLTARHNGGAADVPLAGVPVKAVQEYLRRLVQQGFRVAICEQVEDPKLAKGIVRREVVETVTPGVAWSDDLLDGSRHNFVCAVHRVADVIGVAAADVSTGAFHLALVRSRDADAIMARYAPREVLVASGAGDTPSTGAESGFGQALVTERDAWEFDEALARDELARHFAVHSLDGLGLGRDAAPAVGAAGALLRYLKELQPGGMPQLSRPVLEAMDGSMPLDEMTRRNLELVESLRGETGGGADTAGTLLGVLGRTLTPMGARLLRRWILAPLLDLGAIGARHDAVGSLVADSAGRAKLREALDGVRDLERLAGKTASGRATPRELGALGDSLRRLPAVHSATESVDGAAALASVIGARDACEDIARDIGDTLVDRPPIAIGDDATIRPGVDPPLDELRELCTGGKDAIARIQAEERARTGIASLKVGFNKVFGYYIEVTHANRHLVPDDYQRRQTLTGAERFVTPALKEYEEKVLTATERIDVRERELFEQLRARVGSAIRRLQQAAACVAELDVFAALAEVADVDGYVRPEMHDGFGFDVTAGRHPVVERMMPRETFIPNDVRITADERVLILTGPNMAGKSTILRMIGLLPLLAQIGSFVPARRAKLGVVDRVFTRVGASDNLVRGQSTFMVEMAETSAILHHATARSLVLLDEIGRGTSTYDGVAIAWAVSEHLHNHVGCKTVFATHYHELTQLSDELDGVRNFNVAVREVGDRVLFLHRLQPGGADRSYGIEVGRLAGLPPDVVARARAVLALLEGDHLARELSTGAGAGGGTRRRAAPGSLASPADQMALFGGTHPVLDALRQVDPDRLTPIEALQVLAKLRDDARRA